MELFFPSSFHEAKMAFLGSVGKNRIGFECTLFLSGKPEESGAVPLKIASTTGSEKARNSIKVNGVCSTRNAIGR